MGLLGEGTSNRAAVTGAVFSPVSMAWAGEEGGIALPYAEWLEMWRSGSEDWAGGAVLCTAMVLHERLWLPNACSHCLVSRRFPSVPALPL